MATTGLGIRGPRHDRGDHDDHYRDDRTQDLDRRDRRAEPDPNITNDDAKARAAMRVVGITAASINTAR